jgi:tetratricopeptide (TPR) repeat protein/tRNA A-37 threonylcarbamoyl transferase component Bud32
MDTETRVDGLVDRWEAMRDNGTPVPIEELCAGCPEIATEVQRRIEALKAMDSALATAETEGRATAVDRGRGAAAYRGQPDVLHATAVYRPRRHHDQGGLGVVFTAYQEDLDRTVALKRIRPDKLNRVARQRFLREAAVMARLQHPGIVPIYGVGEDDCGPFYTMPFIRGQTLQEAIDALHADDSLHRDPGRRSLGFRGLLLQFVSACNTVAYAHDQGVLHRDLKPSNIMLGSYGETLVMDWGLGKRFGVEDDETAGDAPSPGPSPEDVTATGEILGTPHYMSPEQAKGEAAGPASDIFSLGLVLYAILTGQSAFAEANLRGVDRLKAVREARIVPPRSRLPHLPRSLEAICVKALAVRPEDRYAAACALADDVTRWLGDEPVTAWREPVSVRARRWARRHRPAMVTAVVALFVGMVGLGAVAVVQARSNVLLKKSNDRTKAALTESEESRKQAEAVSRFLVEAFRSPDPRQDGRQVKVADLLDRASERLDEGFAGSQATRGALLNTLGRTYSGLGLYDRAVNLQTQAHAVYEAALGPDHPVTLGCRINLAAAYAETGRLLEAIKLDEGTLERIEAALGPDHADALKCRVNLAAAYAETGRLLEAIKLDEGTLERMELKLGPDHPETLVTRNNLAVSYEDAGRLPEAIALFERTHQHREAQLGPDHPDTLQSRHTLAGAYANAGRTSDAIELDEGTLKLRTAKFGPDHPDTLASLNNLAVALRDAGRLSEAIALFESALKREKAQLGPDHPDTLISQNNLAGVCDQLGQWTEAEGLYRDVLARCMKAPEPDSTMLAVNLTALGRNLLAQSQWLQAESCLRQALSIREEAKVVDWNRYDSMSLLGATLLGQGQYAKAEPLVVAGYEGMKAREVRIPVPKRPRIREAAERVVHLYESWGLPEKAVNWKADLGMADLPVDVFARP